MPAPPMWMNSSGMDIQGTIKKLMELERQPAKRLEMDNEMNSVLIRAWDEVLKRTRLLQDKSRDLYSFSGPFATRSVTSSLPGAITGEATAQAQAGNQNVEILSLASKHQVHSASVPNDSTLPAGTFSIAAGTETRTFRFPGGTLRDLHALVQAEVNLPFEISRTGIDANSSMISIRSNQSGTVGALTFSDPDGILRQTGLLQPGGAVRPPVEARINLGGTDLTLREKKTGNFQARGDHLVLEDQVQVALNRKFSPDSILTFQVELKTKTGQEIVVGPQMEEKFGSETLPGLNLSRRGSRTQATAAEASQGKIVVEYQVGNETRQASRPYQAGSQSLTIKDLTGGVEASAIVFESAENDIITVKDLQEKKVDAPPSTDLGPANVSTPAQDARLKVNGVEITRTSNDKITDIIEGVSLNLHQTTQGPVSLKIEINTDDILEKMNAWIAAYNDLMKFLRENSNVDVKAARSLAESEGQDPGKVSSGIFATDATVRQLSNTLRSVVSEAYPARYKPAYKLLADVGITTGAPGTNFADIQYGYLVLDQERFRAALTASPEAVKELFAQDFNNDTRLDHGAAFKMRESLDAYTRLARGIIPGRIELIKTQTRSNTDRIARIEATIQHKESNLRDKFGRMESAIGKSKATSNYLKNQMRGGGGGD